MILKPSTSDGDLKTDITRLETDKLHSMWLFH